MSFSIRKTKTQSMYKTIQLSQNKLEEIINQKTKILAELYKFR